MGRAGGGGGEGSREGQAIGVVWGGVKRHA